MPASPDGHRELAAVDMRPEQGSVWWMVGWYGSDLTISIDLDRPPERQALWCRHYTSGAKANIPRPLSHDDPYPHLRLGWTAIPDAVRTRILAEVALGVHPLAGSSNDWPLNPF